MPSLSTPLTEGTCGRIDMTELMLIYLPFRIRLFRQSFHHWKCSLPILTLLTPTARGVSRASVKQISRLGLPRSRAASLLALAKLCAETPSLLRPGASPDTTRERLRALPGVGARTAEYVVMRALHWPDGFPETDVDLRRALEASGATSCRRVAEPWRPWRSYAAFHLWTQLDEARSSDAEPFAIAAEDKPTGRVQRVLHGI